jgi:hypothetical protein
MMKFYATRTVGGLVLGALLCTPPMVAAQQQTGEFQPSSVAGWTFTPGVVFGALHDTNVTLLATQPTQSPIGDSLFEFHPFGELDYYSARSTMNAGYRGQFRRYIDLDALNSADQRAFFTWRYRLNRRVNVFTSENFSATPTTDQLLLYGVPFQRRGSRYNAIAGTVDARLTRALDLSVHYDNTWVDFADSETPFSGGYVNGVRTSLTNRFTDRVSFGGEYEARWANLNGGLRQQLFQDMGALFRYRIAEDTQFEAAGGLALLNDRDRDLSRSGPYVRVEMVHRTQRATFGGEFNRSYVPSVAFGGTNQNESLRGYILMPLNRNRLYIQESGTWHRIDPFDPTELPLQSAWLTTVVGYRVQRWFRLEGYHALTRQDTHQAGGLIHRQVFGVQFVVSEPVRIH